VIPTLSVAEMQFLSNVTICSTYASVYLHLQITTNESSNLSVILYQPYQEGT
jgi:hypothetical protein